MYLSKYASFFCFCLCFRFHSFNHRFLLLASFIIIIYYYYYLLLFIFNNYFIIYLFYYLFVCLFVYLSVSFFIAGVDCLTGCLCPQYNSGCPGCPPALVASRRLTYHLCLRFPKMRHQDAPFSGIGLVQASVDPEFVFHRLQMLGLARRRISRPCGPEAFLSARHLLSYP